MHKRGNLYCVNSVNSVNDVTVNTENTWAATNNENNMLIDLRLLMDQSLPVWFTPLIDFEKTRYDENEISRLSYINYSERNFTDLLKIANSKYD